MLDLMAAGARDADEAESVDLGDEEEVLDDSLLDDDE
jgi:DNA gyrase, A subunit